MKSKKQSNDYLSYSIIWIPCVNNRLNSSVAVCTDISGKEPHTQVGMGTVIASGSLGSVMTYYLQNYPGTETRAYIIAFQTAVQH